MMMLASPSPPRTFRSRDEVSMSRLLIGRQAPQQPVTHVIGVKSGRNYRLCQRISEHLQLLALEAELALGLIDRDFVPPAPTGGAIGLRRTFGAGKHPFERQVGKGIHLEELANLL